MATWSNTRPRLPLPARERSCRRRPSSLPLAEHSEVCEFEHRSAFAERDDVMHLEPAVTGFVGAPQWHGRVGIGRTGTPSPGSFFFWKAPARSGIVGRAPQTAGVHKA
jgi:hypothetical protein